MAANRLARNILGCARGHGPLLRKHPDVVVAMQGNHALLITERQHIDRCVGAAHDREPVGPEYPGLRAGMARSYGSITPVCRSPSPHP